jgi:rubrerythrin
VKAFGSVDEILEFAIGKEEESARFYEDLARRVERPSMRQVFEDFAGEERGHKEKLLAVKGGKLLLPAADKVMDLKLADYLTDVEASPALDYQEALVLAMKEEKAAFRLYSDLASATEDETLRATLLALAQEEARHKLRFEIEYDELLTEN